MPMCVCCVQRLHDQCVVMLAQDSFYKGLTPEEKDNAAGMPLPESCMCGWTP